MHCCASLSDYSTLLIDDVISFEKPKKELHAFSMIQLDLTSCVFTVIDKIKKMKNVYTVTITVTVIHYQMISSFFFFLTVKFSGRRRFCFFLLSFFWLLLFERELSVTTYAICRLLLTGSMGQGIVFVD